MWTCGLGPFYNEYTTVNQSPELELAANGLPPRTSPAVPFVHFFTDPCPAQAGAQPACPKTRGPS